MEKFSTQASVKRPGKLEQLKPGQELEGGKTNTTKNSSKPHPKTFFLSTGDDLFLRFLGGWKVVRGHLMCLR